MQSEEEMKPQDNAPDAEPTPINSNSEAAPSESESWTPDQSMTEPAGEEAISETTQEKPAAARLPRLQVGQPHPKKTFGARLLPWVIVALLFYLGGLATIYFALHLPKVDDIQSAAAEQAALVKASAENDAARIIELTDDYNQALKQYQTAQATLDLTKGELDAARSTIADQEAELARLTKSNIAYKFLMHVSTARTALEQQDTASARQAVNLAKTDLDALKQTDVTADILAGFAEKLNEASSNITLTGIDRARAALDTLYTNLLLLIENMP